MAWLEGGGVAGTKTGRMPTPGAFVEAGISQLNTDGMSIPGFLATADPFSGGIASQDVSGGRLVASEAAVPVSGEVSAKAAVSGGEAASGAEPVFGSGKLEWFVASAAVDTAGLAAKEFTLVLRLSGRRSGGSPAGKPAGLGGWKRNGAAPVAGR